MVYKIVRKEVSLSVDSVSLPSIERVPVCRSSPKVTVEKGVPRLPRSSGLVSGTQFLK